MGRSKLIDELTNLLALSLRHKIGSIVNKEDIYSKKYANESLILLNNAKKSIFGIGFNIYEKKEIHEKLNLKLKKELESKPFLHEEKFEIMGEEIIRVLKELNLLVD